MRRWCEGRCEGWGVKGKGEGLGEKAYMGRGEDER